MFLRKMGNRYLLLHSYREGDGRVSQRRIHTFQSSAELARALEDRAWNVLIDEVARRCPELRPDWTRLRSQAETALESRTARGQSGARPDKLWRAVRTLANLLDKETDPDVLQRARRELSLLQERLRDEPPDVGEAERMVAEGKLEDAKVLLEKLHRDTAARLPARRRRFDPGEERAQPYLKTLDLLAECLTRRNEHDQAARILAERSRACPTPDALARYGASLARTGNDNEALKQFARLPFREARRFYNEAAVVLSNEEWKKGLGPLLRALARDKSLADYQKNARKLRRIYRSPELPRSVYWEQFEALWSETAQEFLEQVLEVPYVRMRVRKSAGRAVHRLIPESAHATVLTVLKERASRRSRDPLSSSRPAGSKRSFRRSRPPR